MGTVALTWPGGIESYCLTVARALDRLGHDVTLFAEELGPLADRALQGGFHIARESRELPGECDAVLANDAITAGLLADRYPAARLVYCIHTAHFDAYLPPLASGLVDAVVAPSERFAAHGRALALDVPVVRLAQPIDTQRFVPSEAPRLPPRRALLLTNYLNGRRRDALVETWTAAGIECVQIGAGHHVAFDVRPEIARADIVVAKARAALEGMASGKAVYVFDTFGGDGWVTGENYAALEANNFAGLATDRPVDRRGLAADLERYDPDMSWVNRELVLTHHSAQTHAQGLVEVLRGPSSRRPDTVSSPAATARTVRYARRMERRAENSAHEAAMLRARVDELTAGLDAWQANAIEAERQLRASHELIRTRRVRAGLALGRFLDRVRRGS
jgi:hypothetical protein